MSEDLVAKFRRGANAAPARAPAPPKPGERVEYIAFKTDRRSPSLSLRTKSEGTWPVGWAFIYASPYDDQTFDKIVIAANVLTATIQGRNLQPIAHSLEERNCDFIQAYDEERHFFPEGYSGPVVTGIDILAGPGKQAKGE